MTQPQEPNEATHPDMFRYYQNGRALQSKGQHQQALESFQNCIKSTDILGVMQYQDIMMCIAFCHADLSQFEQAISIYEKLDRVLSFEGEWYKELGKQKLIVPASFPTSNTATMVKAKVYDSMGIAYDRMRKADEAKSAFGKAIRHYRSLDDMGSIANTFNMMSMGYQIREDWGGMKKLGDYVLQVADKLEAEGKNVMPIRFNGWRLIIQASTNLGDLKTSVVYQEKVVDFMRQTNNPQLPHFAKILEATKRQLGQ